MTLDLSAYKPVDDTVTDAAAITSAFTAIEVAVNAYPPGHIFAYASIASNVTVTGTASGSATAVVSAPSFTFDGSTEVWVEFYSYSLLKGTTSITVGLYDNGSYLGRIAQETAAQAAGFGKTKLTPTSGAHVFSISAFVDAGSGTIGATPDGLPAYVLVTKS